MPDWTKDEINKLREGIDENLTYGQIGAKIGKSRGSISSQVRRLGLNLEKKTRKRTTQRTKISQSKPPRERKRIRLNIKINITKDSKSQKPRKKKTRIRISKVPINQFSREAFEKSNIQPIPDKEGCKWIDGEPRTGYYEWCNRQTVEGTPYCEFHKKVVKQPIPKAKGKSLRPFR